MEFRLIVNCDNAAFGDSIEERGVELAAILRECARRITDLGHNDGFFAVRDTNGNTIGTYEFAEVK